MIVNGPDAITNARRLCLCAGLALVLAPHSIGYADDCVSMVTTKAVPDFMPCTPDARQIYVDAVLSQHTATPTRDAARLSTPWIANTGGGIPATVNASGDSVSMRTSLGTLRDYNAREAARSLDASPIAPFDFALPKAVAAPSAPLDVWSNVDVQGYEGSRDQSVRTGVGANYALSRATAIGVSAERGDVRREGTALVEQDAKMSAFVTLKAAPMLSLQARSDWQAGNAEFAATQGTAEKNSISLSPRLDHQFTLDGGTTIEPFMSFTHQFDTSAVGREAEAAGQSAAAGVKYTAPDAYALSVTTDLQGVVGAKEAESLSSKIQLSVPIK